MKTDYKVGQKVRATNSNSCGSEISKGDVLYIKDLQVNGRVYSVWTKDKKNWWAVRQESIEPYEEYIQGEEYEFSGSLDWLKWHKRIFICEYNGGYIVDLKNIKCADEYTIYKHIRPIKKDNSREIERLEKKINKINNKIEKLKS